MVSSQGYGTLSIFSQKEEIMSDMLTRAGLKHSCSRVLLSLHARPGITSREIERMSNLRQPEVSIAIKYLLEMGWVSSCEYYPDESARTIKVYRLTQSFDTILDSLMINTKDQCNTIVATIDLIREKRNLQ